MGKFSQRTGRQAILPAWLSVALTSAFLFSGITVSIFVFLTADAFLHRPLNPVAAAAEEVAGIDLRPLEQEGPLQVPSLPPNEPTPTPLPTQLPWGGSDRITVLLMGIDRRPGDPFISRTDSIMLISYNPATNQASILSVPRDLYVVIPGYGRDRINTAFVYGARGNNPAAGAALSMQTITYNLGVPIDHYILVDFNAVTQTVDALGGIDVNVPFDIYDPTYPDMYYGYDPLYIPAGWQHMNGEVALKYARTRHVDNDFGRAQRQQQVVLAVRDRMLSLGVGELLRQAPFLYQQVSESVRTDLSLDQIVRLAKSASDVPAENIRSGVLDYDYVISYTTESGASVLVLVNDKAAALIQSLFFDE